MNDWPNIPVIMIRDHLNDIPSFNLRDGYTIRPFNIGDERYWAQIETAAGEFRTEADALGYFENEFGGHIAQMEERCLFIADPEGRLVGTTTAWYSTFRGELRGRIHWVAIDPREQGKKMAKPLLSHALRRLAAYHGSAYLTTQTVSYKAIKMYLDFGFKPCFVNDTCEEAWRLLEHILQRPILSYRVD